MATDASLRAGRGRFLVLDGIDGCGKTTQAARVVSAWTRPGREPPLHVREPGGTVLGEGLRELLLGRGSQPTAAVETLLFAASRRQMLDEVVAPALAAGRDVVCERGNPSTFAYQACAGELDEGAVVALLESWCGEPAPDCVVWLDLPVETAARRRGRPLDRIEDKGVEFQRRVAEGYARWARTHPDVVRVDAGGSADEVAERLAAALSAVRAGVPGGAS